MPKDPFDFSDTSDLPEELQQRLSQTGGESPMVTALVDVVHQGATRGYTSLNINQIHAAAIRLGHDPGAKTTVRNHLNTAVATGRLIKPTRQTYAVPDAEELQSTAKPGRRTRKEDTGTEVPVVTELPSDDPFGEDPLAHL